ncbi:MAG: hypothetical protein M1326_03400, partial [Cyanobacteria bacterium]|nr:hypothetical protein [Cyanobacteriota bacterium]
GRMILNFIDYFKNLSSSILKIFTLNMTSGSYPYSNLYSGSNLLIILAFGYMVFLIGALFFKKNKEEKNWLHYMIAFIILFFLLMRMTSPFDKINAFIYDKIPGFKLFRSPEKLFVFYPFFYLILLSLLLFYSKFSKKIITAFLIIILLIPIPFYIGDIPEYLSHKDSMGTRYAIQLPLDYYKIEEIIDRDKSQLSIISLPYCGDFGGNWSNYSKWHFFGADFSALLYKRLFISANNFDNPTIETKLSFKEYNDAGIVDKEKFIALLQKFSGKYVILHKDITKEWIDKSQTVYDTINVLESDKILKQLDNNDYFTLYELADDYLMPLISSDKSEIYFQKINPVEYRILIPDLKEKTMIEFHQSYDAQWKLYLKSNQEDNWIEPIGYYKDIKATEFMPAEKIFKLSDLSYMLKKPIFDGTHQMVKDYANSWTVDPQFIKENYPKGYYIENKDGSISLEMTIYFRPQSYFYGGFILDFSLIALGLGYFLGYSIWNKKKKN